jgi:BTB/POZ domain/MATH domain
LWLDNATTTTMMKIATLGKPMELSPVVTLRFVIHGFAKLKEVKGGYVRLPSLSAHGYDWTVDLYPRGDDGSDGNPGEGQKMSFYLRLIDEDLTEQDEVEAEFDLTIGARLLASKRISATYTKHQRSCWGSCFDRAFLLNQDHKMLLPNGTLIIDVDLQIQVEKRAVWYPPTHIPNGDTQLLANLLVTGRCSDVTFHVGHQDFRLHSFMLEKRAPVLFRMIEEHPEQTIITLDDDEEEEVDAAMFQIIVRYIYTSEWPAVVDADVATTILTLADRFKCINLKHYVESVMVEKFLDQDNAADMLLLGDSYTCAQLKEAAIQIFQNQADTVMSTEGWKHVKESNALLAELLSVLATAQQSAAAGSTADDDPEGQCVAELRHQLLKRGLDVDGSRETLVKRLKAE